MTSNKVDLFGDSIIREVYKKEVQSMENNSLTDGLKKIFLAGVGAMALTYEKADELLGEMVEKGEITVEQGKALNQELKRTVKENTEKSGVKSCKCEEEKDLSKIVEGLSKDELGKLKDLIAEAEGKE